MTPLDPDGAAGEALVDPPLGDAGRRRGAGLELELEGPVVEWRGPAPYYFMAISAQDSMEIKASAKGLEYWGQVPVVARIGDEEFTTALFPKDGRYLVPLKDQVRRSAEIEVGEVIALAVALRRR